MKVLFCTALDPTRSDGATIYTARVLRALHRLGLDVRVLMIQFCSAANFSVGQDWFPGLRELQDEGIPFNVYPAKQGLGSFMRALINLSCDALRQVKSVDVFAFRVAYFQPLSMLTKAIRPTVTTLWFHDGIVEEVYFVHSDFKRWVFWRIFEVFEKLGSYFVDWEFPVSEKMLNYSLNKGIHGRRGSVVLPCVVELNRFYPRPAQGCGNRKEIIVGFAGSLAPWQDFEGGCRFLQFLSKSMDIRLHVLTAEAEKARKITVRHHLDTCIEWVRHEEVPKKMDQWDFALVPQKAGLITKVCSPLKAAEALSKGVPLLICPEVGDFSEMVERNGIGVVFDPDDSSAWPIAVDVLRHILDNYEAVSQRARSLAEELYEWGILPQKLSKVLGSK